eukprot:g2974.t1
MEELQERLEAQGKALMAAKEDHHHALTQLQQQQQAELKRLFGSSSDNSALCDRLLAVEAEKTQLFVANSVAQRQLARLVAALQQSGREAEPGELDKLRASIAELETERESSLREKRAWLAQLQSENRALQALQQQAQASKEELVREMNHLVIMRGSAEQGLEQVCSSSPLASDTSDSGSALHQSLVDIAMQVQQRHAKHASDVQAQIEAIEWRFIEGVDAETLKSDVNALRQVAQPVVGFNESDEERFRRQDEQFRTELAAKEATILQLQTELSAKVQQLDNQVRLNKVLQVASRRRQQQDASGGELGVHA